MFWISSNPSESILFCPFALIYVHLDNLTYVFYPIACINICHVSSFKSKTHLITPHGSTASSPTTMSSIRLILSCMIPLTIPIIWISLKKGSLLIYWLIIHVSLWQRRFEVYTPFSDTPKNHVDDISLQIYPWKFSLSTGWNHLLNG